MERRELSFLIDLPRHPTPEDVAVLQRIWGLYRFGLPDLSEAAEHEPVGARFAAM